MKVNPMQGLERSSDAALGRARISISAAFFGFAFAAGNWAPRIPAVKDAVGVDDTTLGFALAGMTIGALAGTQLAVRPINRFGSTLCIRLSFLALCLALVGPGLARSFLGLLLSLTLLGAAIGFLDVAVNAHAVVVERGYGRPIMAGLHALYSVGALAGSVSSWLATEMGVLPLVHFALVGGVTAAGGVVMLRGLLADQAPEVASREDSAPRAPLGLWSPAVLLLGVVGFSSFVGEGAASDWSAVYLRDHLHTTDGFATGGVIAFSLAMAATRFVSDRLSMRFGAVAVVRVGALVAAAGLGFSLLAFRPVVTLVGFGLMGAGLAPVVPAVFSAGGNFGDGASNTLLSRVVTMAYLGSISGPVLIGLLTSWVTLRGALGLVVVLALMIAVLADCVSPAADAA